MPQVVFGAELNPGTSHMITFHMGTYCTECVKGSFQNYHLLRSSPLFTRLSICPASPAVGWRWSDHGHFWDLAEGRGIKDSLVGFWWYVFLWFGVAWACGGYHQPSSAGMASRDLSSAQGCILVWACPVTPGTE